MTTSTVSTDLGTVTAPNFREQKSLLFLAISGCTKKGSVMSLRSELGTRAPEGCMMGHILDGVLTLDLLRCSKALFCFYEYLIE